MHTVMYTGCKRIWPSLVAWVSCMITAGEKKCKERSERRFGGVLQDVLSMYGKNASNKVTLVLKLSSEELFTVVMNAKNI